MCRRYLVLPIITAVFITAWTFPAGAAAFIERQTFSNGCLNAVSEEKTVPDSGKDEYEKLKDEMDRLVEELKRLEKNVRGKIQGDLLPLLRKEIEKLREKLREFQSEGKDNERGVPI